MEILGEILVALHGLARLIRYRGSVQWSTQFPWIPSPLIISLSGSGDFIDKSFLTDDILHIGHQAPLLSDRVDLIHQQSRRSCSLFTSWCRGDPS